MPKQNVPAEDRLIHDGALGVASPVAADYDGDHQILEEM